MEDFLTKTTYVKNLNKLNFTSQVGVNIDANVNIKTILDVESFVYDCSVQCSSGKANVTAKLGVKVLYIDTDNITNTTTTNSTITETIVDTAITSDSFICLTNITTANYILDSTNNLKISCQITASPILYLNIGLGNTSANYENLVVKKSEIETCCIGTTINTNFDYSINLETKNNVAKVLMCNAYFTPTNITSADGYAIIEGKLFNKVMYETQIDENTQIKTLCNTFTLKTQIEIPNLVAGDMLDLNFAINKNKEVLNTEIEEDNSIITISHNIQVCGVSLKTMSVEIVDDIYSTENEIELTTTTREFNYLSECNMGEQSISGEIIIEDNQPLINDIVANLGITTDITNCYIKDESIYLEGIVSSCAIYTDEDKNCTHKQVELPFIINTHIACDKLECVHVCASVCEDKVRTKRGNVIELDYTIKFNICNYHTQTKDILSNFVLGKPLDFSAYDYQIFLAKPGETCWDVCKRIKISPEELNKINKDLPLVMQGGEKIIIKRG